MIRINIKIIGTDCSNGMKLSKMVSKALEEANCKAEIEEIDNSSKNKYGIKNVPGLVINGQIVSQGKVLSIREIKKLLLA